MPVYRYFFRAGQARRRVFLGRIFVIISLISGLVAVLPLGLRDSKVAGRASKDARIGADGVPFQEEISRGGWLTFVQSDYTWRVQPRAVYQIAARVLERTTYDDWQADFSPVDLALGWGLMGDPAVDEWVEVRQENRWYFYEKDKRAPISLEDIRSSSANVHIIPADESVSAVVQGLEANDVVLMEGKLVDVEVERLGEMFHFKTSLTRLDADENSCEIFYVERIVVGDGSVWESE